MESVFDIAKWFLNKESMTHKKLQKLCYYAQAWHLALLKEPLFEDEIQAWIHGPVIPTLYPYYADYRWLNIPKVSDKPNFDERTDDLLEAVFATYGEFTGDQLERLTHSEIPWLEARGNLKPFEPCEIPISRDTMQKYYGQKYKQAQGD